ncbi:MAG: fused MFS/spermidine synthase [Ardenticatenia bacterium]|nr:fused MFS/spermidine synthase [Ardenticatenia bacterium]
MRAIRLGLVALGFTAIIAQVVLMRELVATFYGNELLYGLTLMAWLAWVAAGSWGLGRLVTHRGEGAPRSGLGTTTFAVGLALCALLLVLQIALVRGARIILDVTPGAFVEFGPMVGAVVLIPAPLCLLAGFLFTLGVHLMVERGSRAGHGYAWESAGAVVGGALFSFVFIRWMDPFQTALLVGAVNLGVAAYLGLGSSLARVRLLLVPLVASLIAVALLVGDDLHLTTLRWQWSDLAFADDSPYGRLIIEARDGQRSFFQDGLLSFETQSTFAEEVAHFPLLAHPDPGRVLLVGGGVAGDVREALKHPVTEVTYVERDPQLIEAARAQLPAEDAAVLNDSRVSLVLTDGRRYVQTAPHTFDVIILDLPPPATGALNRFYTREFFGEAHAILRPGGIFALGLPSAENYWSPELARRNGSVYHTLRSVFPEVVALTSGDYNFFLASDIPLETDPAVLAGRLGERGIETRWVTPSYVEYVLTTDRFAGGQRQLEATWGVPLNRDLTPSCYYYDLALWLSRFYPYLRQPFESAGAANLGWIAMPLAVLVLLARWRRKWAVPITIACVGLAEMMLTVLILFGFQVLHGTVYARVSLIITATMAGLALGAAASNWLLGRWSPDVEGKARRVLLALQLAVALCSVVFLLVLSLPVPAPGGVFLLLALVAAFLPGMAFPLAVVLVRGRADSAAGMLYGVDLVGGCLGAGLTVTLLVPVLGIPQVCGLVVLVGLAGLLALV